MSDDAHRTKKLGLTREERLQLECALKFLESIRAFAVLVGHQVDASIPAPAVPSWVKTCFEHWWQTVGRNIPDLGDGTRDKNNVCGFVHGYLRWMRYFLEEMDKHLPPLPEVPKLPPKAEALIDQAWLSVATLDGYIKPGELDEFADEVEKGPEIPSFLLNAEPDVAHQFHSGAAEGSLGLSGTADGSILKTDAFEVYLLLILFHWVVDKMKSTADLHAWLCRIIGNNRTGSKERIRKICLRVGKHFRGPGRPRKMGQVEKP